MEKYSEYTRTIETEVGTLEIIYMTEDGVNSVQVWLNHGRLAVPESWTKQTSQTIVKKVVQLVKSASKLGVQIGGSHGN